MTRLRTPGRAPRREEPRSGVLRREEPRAARRGRSTRRAAAAVAALGALGASLLWAPAAQADQIRSSEWPLAFLDASAADKIADGSGVTVGLLDTGVMGERADLTGQVTTGPDYAGGAERPGGPGWGEHGTCMASIIAGHGRGAGAGMLGIAPAAHILSVRVIRDDDAPDVGAATKDPTPISDGIMYAVNHGAQVISMSLGGNEDGAGSDSTPEADAVRYALAHNVVVVVAAGNSGQSGDQIEYPGAERGVIAVAAVDSSGRVAPFSTSGWDVDLAAPGVNLPCDAADSDDEYLVGDGTSQATAYVAGIVALLKSENHGLSPAQVRDILEQTAREKPAGGRDDKYGFGVVDPVAALKLAAKTKPAVETVAAGAVPAGGYFGFGPTEVVSQSGSSLGAMSRAIIGGVLILAAAGWFVRRSLRAAGTSASGDGSAAMGAPQFPAVPGWIPESGWGRDSGSGAMQSTQVQPTVQLPGSQAPWPGAPASGPADPGPAPVVEPGAPAREVPETTAGYFAVEEAATPGRVEGVMEDVTVQEWGGGEAPPAYPPRADG